MTIPEDAPIDPPLADHHTADLLTIDRGNSTLDLMLHGDPSMRRRLPVRELEDFGSVLAALPRRPSRAVGATVVSGGLQLVAAKLARVGLRLELAGVDLPCPLPTRYGDAKTLGVDRWVTALAAHREHGAAIVIDCGTAITVDAVDAAGIFLGGAIAPGLRAMAAGLAAAAPALSTFDPSRPVSVPATSSPAAVDAGVVLAFAGAVDRLVADLRSAFSGSVPVLITGGDAELYLRHGRVATRHVSDLLHRGLRWLAKSTSASSA